MGHEFMGYPDPRIPGKMATLGRGVSMFLLITDGILDPGEDVLTFDYLGKRFSADLLPEGTIQTGGHIYASPYAWASHCKNLINPEQKTAIGWGHIRYKGIKLSQYKSIYMKKHKMSQDMDISDFSFEHNISAATNVQQSTVTHSKGKKKKVMSTTTTADIATDPFEVQTPSSLKDSSDSKLELPGNNDSKEHGQQAALSLTSELVECIAADSDGEKQPFDIVVSSNVLLLMDFHSHLCWSEVIGYIGGRYNKITKTLQIVRVFPCPCNTTDENESIEMEAKIKRQMHASGLSVVGWYHSHPSNDALPSVSDVSQQLMYQECLDNSKGINNPPCIGFIIGPNLADRRSDIQSTLICYSIKRRDSLHASPLSLSYSISWEQFLTQDVADQMNSLAAYFRHRQDSVNFKAPWRDGIPFIHKLKTSLANFQPKFEQIKSDDSFFTFIDQLALQNS